MKSINEAISEKCIAANHVPCQACDIDDCCPRQERGFKNSKLATRTELAAEAAELAFWSEVMNHFPEAEHGDLDPMAAFAFSSSCLTTLKSWVDNNVPAEHPRVYTITFMHTSIVNGEYEFGKFSGKFNSHAAMHKSAQAMMKSFQSVHGGSWDFSWDSKRLSNTRPVGSI